MPFWYEPVHDYSAALFASVLLIAVVFLIARIGRLSQPTALALALSPMLVALALPAIL
jgi:hypothetical protein